MSGPSKQEIPPAPATPNGRVVTSLFVDTMNADTERRSPWVALDSPRPKQGAIVRRVDVRTAPRSISTFSAHNRGNTAAAPFPSIPTRMEIQEQKLLVEQELQSVKAEFSALLHQRQFYDNTSQIGIIPPGTGQGIRFYNNLLICDSLIESVRKENLERKRQSEVKVPPKFRNITDLPFYQKTIDEHSENIEVIFSAHMELKKAAHKHEEDLAAKYAEAYRKWEENLSLIDAHSARVYKLNNDWPAEFPKVKETRLKTVAIENWTAPDQPMFTTNRSKLNNCYYSTNEDVPDPAAAHEEFKSRVSWSDEEKRKFVAKYTQHPKKFRLIAESLPLKTVKDVIEFYYINKFTLSLKDKEGVRRKRGGVKRVVSEGRPGNDVK